VLIVANNRQLPISPSAVCLVFSAADIVAVASQRRAARRRQMTVVAAARSRQLGEGEQALHASV